MRIGNRGASSIVLFVVIAVLGVSVVINGALLISGKRQTENITTTDKTNIACGENSGESDMGPAEVAEEFVDTIRSGDMVGAEEYLTDHGRTVAIQHGMAVYDGVHHEIQADLRANGVANQKVYFDYENTQVSGKTARVPFGIEDANYKVRWSIVLANRDGEWKIDGVEF